MSTYLIKRSIAEHGLPKDDTQVFVLVDYTLTGGEVRMSTSYWRDNGYGWGGKKLPVIAWYEPLSLPQLLEEVKEELLKWVEEEGMFNVAPVDGYEKGEEHAFKMFKEKIISVFNSAYSNNRNNH